MATTRNREPRDDTPNEVNPDPLLAGLDDLEPAGEFATTTGGKEGLFDRLNFAKITGTISATPLLILFGLNAVDELDRTAFSTLLPEIRHAFGLNLQGILTLTTFVTVVNLILELPIGYFADRKNRVRMAI